MRLENNKQFKKDLIKPKKSLGQNFLKNEQICKKIVSLIEIKNKNIIEIGPGKGALTKLILKQEPTFLCAYEIDNDLILNLQEKFNNFSNFVLLNEDFLKSDLSNYKNINLIANIPYYITSEILFKIIHNIYVFDNIVLMVQEEVANRICALKGTKDFGKLSLTMNYFFYTKKCFNVSPKEFFPSPKVVSSIIFLKPRKTYFNNLEKDLSFIEFIKKCFNFRRKTLENNLKSFLNDNQKEKIKIYFNKNTEHKNIRPQEISLEEYINLFIFLYS